MQINEYLINTLLQCCLLASMQLPEELRVIIHHNHWLQYLCGFWGPGQSISHHIGFTLQILKLKLKLAQQI